MGLYEIHDHIRKSVPVGESKSVGDMAYYFLGTFLRSKFGMIVHSCRCILREALRIGYLSYVMVKGTCTHQKHIGINRTAAASARFIT